MTSRSAPVAIIGMAAQFPDASDVEEFWRHLERGHESLRTFSDEEILAEGVEPALLSNPNYVKKGSVLDDFEFFDAAFFAIPPKEARFMDPQHRLLLECGWQALENAGYAGDEHVRIGVYAGGGSNIYLSEQLIHYMSAADPAGKMQLALGNQQDFLATRLSYKYGIRGPSLTIQSGCSTSLAAVDVACHALNSGQCDVALVGAVSLSLPQKAGYLYAEGLNLSKDGHCRPFDAKGTGFRPASGLGVVVLKLLESAVQDRDCIRAVILGSAITNDGSTKAGFAAPSPEGQAEAASEALRRAGIDGDSVGYVEAQAGGTVLGDAIEITALQHTFASKKKQFCAIGSVKGNIGNAGVAAGVASLIKAVLILEHKAIPPSLNFEASSAMIDLADTPFYVSTQHRPWNSAGRPRYVAVNSSAVGGTNAHIILTEAPAVESDRSAWPFHLLLLSAKTSAALDAAATKLADHLSSHSEIELADACFTLQSGRRRFPHRRMFLCDTHERAIAALSKQDRGRSASVAQRATNRAVAFFFSDDNHAPSPGSMLSELIPRYRESLTDCTAFFDCLRPADAGRLFAAEVDDPVILQARTFSKEWSLAQLWLATGVIPTAVGGSGIGKYVAATVAEVLKLEDALRLILARAEAMRAGDACTAYTPFVQLVRQTTFSSPSRRFELCTSGRPASNSITDPNYWLEDPLISPTDGDEGALDLLRKSGSTVLKIASEGTACSVLFSDDIVADQQVPSLRESGDAQAILASAGKLWLAGVRIRCEQLYSGERRKRVPLPSYCFERRRYWIVPSSKRAGDGSVANADDPREPRPLDLAVPFSEASTEYERWLVSTWGQMLGISGIGVDDNFFHLGGDSITAGAMLARIRDHFGFTIHAADFSLSSTIRELALRLESIGWASSPNKEVPGDREEMLL